MKIGVIGASGFIGRAFLQVATEAGHEVVAFSRRAQTSSPSVEWRVMGAELDLTGLDAIVNYAGESVAQRWTAAKLALFHESRVGVTQQLVRAIAALPEGSRPQTLLNASAVGYYGDCDDTLLDEQSPLGSGYLAELCEEWEQAAMAAEPLGVRVVLGRIGIVLGPKGEAWQKMLTAFKLGLGGPLGSGTHWMPWVHVEDVAGASLHSLITPSLSGPLNLVSPEPQRNSDFTRALGAAVRRPAVLPAPAFALRLVFGQFGVHLLDSYRVVPTALAESGYSFRHPKLKGCLESMM